MPLAVGTRLGPYEILSPVGAGGMGEVYRARDLRLDRDVAVKVLPEPMAQDPDARARFLREAKAVAALSHPNILAIHDFGIEHGACYAVTELLEGETLRVALNRSLMPWRRALEYGVMIADGLSAAHAKGIIHRDLKPDNIFLISDGQVKILDFGLARFEAQRPLGADEPTAVLPPPTNGVPALDQTEAGVVMGTAGYMSPEQIRGEKVEAPSDIFALGCVLYEMLCRRRAFFGPTRSAILKAILNETPTDICEIESSLPLSASHMVRRCLERRPEARYQSARDLAFHMREILTLAETRKRAGTPSLAVLPFSSAHLTEEAESLSDGVTETIINNLSRIPQLRVAARSSVFRYKGKDVDCRTAALDLKVEFILTGRIAQRGDNLQVQVDLVDAAEGTQIWGQRFNRKMADIFEVEEAIGREISEALQIKLSGKEEEQLGKRYTRDSEAYQCYLKGRYHWNKRSREGLRTAIEHFSQAIERDPNYALAYCGLADSYGMLSMYRFATPQEVVPQAISAARKALEIDPNLTEAHTSLAFWTMNYEWAWKSSEISFRRALEIDPQNAMAHQWYSANLLCRGRLEEALAEAKLALQLDPRSLSANSSLGWVYHFSRRYDEAIEQYRKTIDLDPNFFLTYHFLAMSYEQKGMYEEAIAACQHVAKQPGGMAVVVGALTHTHAKAGRPDKARQLLEELMRRRQRTYIPAYDLAIIHAGLGEADQMFSWLTEALNERSTWLTYLRLEPRLDPYRSDPRFGALLRQVGLA